MPMEGDIEERKLIRGAIKEALEPVLDDLIVSRGIGWRESTMELFYDELAEYAETWGYPRPILDL
jgi:hypothetical protein